MTPVIKMSCIHFASQHSLKQSYKNNQILSFIIEYTCGKQLFDLALYVGS